MLCAKHAEVENMKSLQKDGWRVTGYRELKNITDFVIYLDGP